MSIHNFEDHYTSGDVDRYLADLGFQGIMTRSQVRDTAGNQYQIKEKTMTKRLKRRERKLYRKYRKLPKAKQEAGRDIVERAAVDLGITEAELAEKYQAGGRGKREVREALQAAASRPSANIEVFAKAGERDWDNFWTNFMECFAEFLPLILAI